MAKSSNVQTLKPDGNFPIDTRINEINQLKLQNPYQALTLAGESWEVIKLIKPAIKQVPFLICYSNCLSLCGKFPESFEIIEKALLIKKHTRENDTEYAILLNLTGEKLLNLNQFSQALPLLLDSKEIFTQANDNKNLITNLLDLGRCYDGLYLFKEAVESLFWAEDLARTHKHDEFLIRIALSLGNVYSDTQDLAQANKYYKKAANLALKRQDYFQYAGAMSSMSKIYTLNHKYDLALKAADEAIRIYQENNNFNQLTLMNLNMGIILNEIKRPSEAMTYLEKAMRDNLDKEDPVLYFRIALSKVVALHLLKKYQPALNYLEVIIALAQNMKAYNLLMPAYLQGYYICSKQKRWKQALDYFINAKNTEYIIWNNEKENQMRQLKADFNKVKETQQAEIYKLKSVELKKKNKLISEQKSQLEIALNELDVANKAKIKLFSIIAHDLRGPLGSIYQGIELIADEPAFREDVNFIRQIQHTAFQVYNMTDNLLRWSATQMNKIVANPQPISVEQLINNVIEQLALIITAKKINLVTDVEANNSIVADPGFLEVIFRNLLSNAIKFTPSRGTVKIEFMQKGNFYICNVLDNGKGIAPEIQKHIFEGKYSSTTGTDNEKGVGLGLPLIKEMVEQMGGSVSVSSMPDNGCTFTFHIPVK